MNEWKPKLAWTASLVVILLLGVTSAVGCGGGATAQPSSTPLILTATVAPLATATPLATAPAQEESPATPTPSGWRPPHSSNSPDPTPFELPYRVIISGPETAHPGDLVTYAIQYQCVLGAQVCDNAKITVRFDWPKAGSLVDFSPVADIASPQGGTAAGVTFHGEGGVDHATLKIVDGFDGDFGLGITLTGSGLSYYWPEGTGGVTTRIVAEPGEEPAAEGYRVIITGPKNAPPGDVTFNIKYQCVLEAGNCGQLSLVFRWSFSGASFVASLPKAEFVAPNEAGFTFPTGASGTAQVVLHAVAGVLMVGVYTGMPGNRYAEGSVISMLTSIP